MSETNNKPNWVALAIVLAIFCWFIWMNKPAVAPEQDYTMPAREGEVRSFDYPNNEWRYYDKTPERVYTQSQVDSIRRYAKNMKQEDFREMMEDYQDDEDAWMD